MNAAVVTVSDGVYDHAREDASGGVLAAAAAAAGFVVTHRSVVPDDTDRIAAEVTRLVDDTTLAIALVLVTGGTGFAPRDVTPEALRGVYHRLAPGIDEAMRAHSMRSKPHGMLSRGVSGIRHSSLILSFPGSPRACAETFAVVAPILDHAVSLLRETATSHL